MSLQEEKFGPGVTEERMCKDVEKSAIDRARREALGEASTVGTLTSDLLFPELWAKRFLLVKPPGLWHFVRRSQQTCMTAYGIVRNLYFISQATVTFQQEGRRSAEI